MLEITTGNTSKRFEVTAAAIWEDPSKALAEKSPFLQHMVTLEDMLIGTGHVVEIRGRQYQFRFFDGSQRDEELLLSGFGQLSLEVIYQRFRSGGISAEMALDNVKKSVAAIVVVNEGEVVGWGELSQFIHPITRTEDPTKIEISRILREDHHGIGVGHYLGNLLYYLACSVEGVESLVSVVNRRLNSVAYLRARRMSEEMGGKSPERLEGGEVMFTIPLRGSIEP